MNNITTFPLTDVLEWSGALIGLIGAFLLSINTNISRYGWVAFLIANFLMIGWGLRTHAYGLVLQQLGFTVTSVIGLYRTGLIFAFAATQHWRKS